jgi:glyceraldehyde-3-phosphate dehydrogenase/erythrose-4-phosphate dehydrogenase
MEKSVTKIGIMVLAGSDGWPLNRPEAEVVGINDLFIDADYIAYILKNNSVRGRFKDSAETHDGKFVVNDKPIEVYAATLPQEISWGPCGAEYVSNPPASHHS